MNTLDAGFYFVEHPGVPMHIGSLAVFEGPVPAYAELFDLFAAKIPRVPRYRQVVRTMPLQLFRPFWADDEEFELSYHLRHAAVPPPGGPAQVREMASRVFAQRLDRDRPLWEAWLLEGIGRDRWAILSKVHHSMVDGVGGSDLLAELFDLTPEPDSEPVPPWTPRPGPSPADVLLSGVLDTLTWPARQLAELPDVLARRLPTMEEIIDFGHGLTGSARRLTEPSASSLNGPISSHRRWTWTMAKLNDVRRIRRGVADDPDWSDGPVTVNDVVLEAISSGFRDLLASRQELTDDLVVRSLVPVSLRCADETHPVSNRISAILVNLPVAEPDPMRRLALLRAQMEDLKRTRQAAGAELLTGLLGFAAPSLLALGSRAAFRLPQPLVQTVTTNVPGPRFPLYVLGRKLIELYPYVPIGNNLRIGVAIFSYLERFTFGVTADYRAYSDADLDVLTTGISRGMADLKAAVKRQRRKES
ncbi:MAG TPA: wax ester/triacylglycerol synthase family O-acyltransferase [Streptosporangiaceae bacterium]|nr:wax ester/triacylglycerol synthase family O-acyltransferase [Streptosporangiaceae bacterium]